MADSKISALPASTTPLAGTEVLPIVQSSTTKQVSVANLTAGRAISATQLTLTTGNLIVASGQGIDFSATPGTGTSELLADYEEGTWTGTLTAATPPTVAVTATGNYTKIGRQVTVNIQFSNVSTVGAVGTLQITGLPFTPSFDALGACGKVAQSANVDSSYVANGNTSIRLVTQNGLGYEAIIAVVGVYLWVSISYFV